MEAAETTDAHVHSARFTPRLRAWPDGFNRLSHAQGLAAAGDALVAVSLAGSLFFNISPDASREQVLIYLLVNMLPFTLLAPLVGPAVDKVSGARRILAAGLFSLRAVLTIGLALTLADLGFYFFALALIIVGRASGVTKQALVPTLVDAADDLVAANARLARFSLIAGGIAGGGGALLAAALGPSATLFASCACFVAAAVLATRLPKPSSEPQAVDEVQDIEFTTHIPLLTESAWGFTVIRGAVGFFAFGIAYALRRESEPAYMYGLAGAAWAGGTFFGNAVAPGLRKRFTEDRLIAGALLSLATVASFAALGPSRPLVLLVAAVLGIAASVARQGFDALVQAHSPQERRGRAFARFETRFQLGWLAGAVGATAVGFPIQVSMAVVASAMIPAGLIYVQSIRRVRQRAHDLTDPLSLLRLRTDNLLGIVAVTEVERTRALAIEVAATVDLALADGLRPDAELVATSRRLREQAVDGGDPPIEEIAECLRSLSQQLEPLLAADATDLASPSTAADGSDTDPTDRDPATDTAGERVVTIADAATPPDSPAPTSS